MKKPMSNWSVMPMPPCICTPSWTASVAVEPARALATATAAPALAKSASSVCSAFSTAADVEHAFQQRTALIDVAEPAVGIDLDIVEFDPRRIVRIDHRRAFDL